MPWNRPRSPRRSRPVGTVRLATVGAGGPPRSPVAAVRERLGRARAVLRPGDGGGQPQARPAQPADQAAYQPGPAAATAGGGAPSALGPSVGATLTGLGVRLAGGSVRGLGGGGPRRIRYGGRGASPA